MNYKWKSLSNFENIIGHDEKCMPAYNITSEFLLINVDIISSIYTNIDGRIKTKTKEKDKAYIN